MKNGVHRLWSDRRRDILNGMGHLPVSLCVADRDADAIAALLIKDGVIEPAGLGRHRMTAAGKILHAMNRLDERGEGGPWGMTDLRAYAAVKQLDMTVCKDALLVLEQRGIIAAQPSKRTPKWDLMKS